MIDVLFIIFIDKSVDRFTQNRITIEESSYDNTNFKMFVLSLLVQTSANLAELDVCFVTFYLQRSDASSILFNRKLFISKKESRFFFVNFCLI